MSVCLVWTLIFLFICSAVRADSCAPLFLPIQYVALESPTVTKRGAFLTIGTPPQNVSMEISPFVHYPAHYFGSSMLTSCRWVNNTWIFDQSGQCDASIPPIQCVDSRGSNFDEKRSSTWAPSNVADDRVPENQGAMQGFGAAASANDLFGTDTLRFSSSISLPQFPLRIPRVNWQSEGSMLGLGSQSTFLNGLQNSGIISSRVWSYWWGLTGLGRLMDGGVVFGGFDQAKTKGNNYTQMLRDNVPSCPTQIVTIISGITMNFANGTKKNILGSSHGSALQMCINPTYPLITIPFDIWSTFSDYAGGTFLGRSYGINLWGMLYSADDVYDGSITFTIDNSLDITIPNDQLIQPDLAYDVNGKIDYNKSTREIMLNSLQDVNADDEPQLGHTFLSAAYLMVNRDANTYTLWQANPTDDQQLVTYPSATPCNASASRTPEQSDSSSSPSHSPSPTLPSLPSSSTSILPKPPHSSNSGAIAGGVVGGIAVTAVLLSGFLYFRKTRRANVIKKQDDTPSEDILLRQTSHQHHAESYVKAELPDDHKMELPTTKTITVYELD
ncbi:aspartic peptidase domain-containing protein [Xylogone sp. PMI_703]|nr:aspartic peptidase domain-containing protein [Xylogone sp. PMI_703]